ncbi:MAG TPA: DUF1236 domain-containing protein [Microvirga sp.]|nr:DUF1236 domain-containing protein [Microvirga sp.]
MRPQPLHAAPMIVLLASSLAACAGATGGATGGALAGAAVGGPVGAVVGGVAGAAVGAALTPEETTRVQQFVVTQRVPSVRLREEVTVGYRVPARVALRPLPPEVGVRRTYSYTVINERPVLVDPMTREVVLVL